METVYYYTFVFKPGVYFVLYSISFVGGKMTNMFYKSGDFIAVAFSLRNMLKKSRNKMFQIHDLSLQFHKPLQKATLRFVWDLPHQK